MTRTRRIAQAGIIAAAYAVVTLLVIQNPFGFGPVQFRVSEALTVVALFTPAAAPGLALGCALANLAMVGRFGPMALLDVAFGSLATYIGARWTYKWRARPLIALAGPVVANAVIVPAYLPLVLGAAGFYDVNVLGVDVASSWPLMYVFGVVTVAAGEALVVYGLGMPVAALLHSLDRAGMFGHTTQD